MVRRRLGRGIRRARIVATRLGEMAVIGQRAEYLVGRDMQEAEAIGASAKSTPLGKRGLQKYIGANHVGVDELGRAVDRPIDMALGREMHDRVGAEGRENVGDG